MLTNYIILHILLLAKRNILVPYKHLLSALSYLAIKRQATCFVACLFILRFSLSVSLRKPSRRACAPSAFPLLEVEELAEPVADEHHVGCQPRLPGLLLGRVIEHARAEAHPPVVALEDVVVATSLAALPELFVVGQFRESHGNVSHPRVELHDRKRRGDAE